MKRPSREEIILQISIVIQGDDTSVQQDENSILN